MPEVTWTDEAIETWLRAYAAISATYKKNDTEKLLYAAMLELKRVRAWAKYGLESPYVYTRSDYQDVLGSIFNGAPAPSEKEPS